MNLNTSNNSNYNVIPKSSCNQNTNIIYDKSNHYENASFAQKNNINLNPVNNNTINTYRDINSNRSNSTSTQLLNRYQYISNSSSINQQQHSKSYTPFNQTINPNYLNENIPTNKTKPNSSNTTNLSSKPFQIISFQNSSSNYDKSNMTYLGRENSKFTYNKSII